MRSTTICLPVDLFSHARQSLVCALCRQPYLVVMNWSSNMATRESFSDKQLDKRTLTRRRDPLLKVLGPTRIFISYRVNESQDAAESVRKRLQKAFLPHSVFMDWNKIRTGEDFMRAIKHEISRSHIFILLISEK